MENGKWKMSIRSAPHKKNEWGGKGGDNGK